MAQEREWTLDRTDQDVFLVFGTPETDDVGASFWCRIGSKKLRLFLPVTSSPAAPGAASLQVILPDQEFKLAVVSNQNDTRESNTLEAEFDSAGPLAKSLHDNDFFTVVYNGTKRSFPLANADIDGLISLCTNPPAKPEP